VTRRILPTQTAQRAEAARALIRADPHVDRLVVLSYVVWPTARLQQLAAAKPRCELTAEELAARHRFENRRSSYKRAA
jgi:hypothetical protein